MQGFNMGRYVPPEHEGTVSANKLAGKHALGNRARKAGQGILTVRFEMPYPIWCTTCPKPTIIGQGVRFNAEKKKVGNYFSTAIFSFRMKHSACGGWIEIRTDPKNTAYVVTEGAKKRDTGEDKVLEGDVTIRTEEERQRLKNDAFAALEVKIDDRKQAATDKSRVEELLELKEKDWDDPYAASRRLRKVFRIDRKVRHKNAVMTEALKDRMSLSMDLLEESEEDRRRASLIEFGEVDDASTEAVAMRVHSKGLFATDQSNDSKATRASSQKKILRGEQEAAARREALARELRDNTRASLDPFLKPRTTSVSTAVAGLKRKKNEMLDTAPAELAVPMTGLVDYDSD